MNQHPSRMLYAHGATPTVTENVDPSAAEHALSNNQRRLLAAITDLPQPWMGPRQERSEGEILGRTLSALRTRLDWLVQVEEQYGEDQKAKGWNRAERNALIRVLQDYAEEAGEAIERRTGPGRMWSPEHVANMHEQAGEAIEAGYTVTSVHAPGVLMHRNEGQPDRTVPMVVWFFVRGYVRGLEDLG